MEIRQPLSSIDKSRVRKQFNSAAGTYENFDFLQQEVSNRLFDRLQDILVSPRLILDLGSGTGRAGDLLEKSFKKSKVINLDIAEDMLIRARDKKKYSIFRRQRFLCGDIEAIPLKPNIADLVYSNLAIQWCPNLRLAFRAVKDVLKPGTIFIFSTLGPDTLRELREVFSTYSDMPHVNTFLDMHDVGDILSSSGFSDPVIESEEITVNYDSAAGLLRDLKGIGASNADSERRKSLTGPTRMRKILKEYEKYRCNDKIPATYEVILGHAWAVKSEKNKEHTLRRLK